MSRTKLEAEEYHSTVSMIENSKSAPMDPLKAAPVVFPQPRSLTQDGKGIIQVVWPHLAWQDIPQQSKYPNHIPRLPIVDENQTLFIRKDDPKSIRSRRFVVVSTNRFDGLIPRWTMGLACTKATISSSCVIMESKAVSYTHLTLPTICSV